MKSTPVRPSSIIRLTALEPPPPSPMTFRTGLPGTAIALDCDVPLRVRFMGYLSTDLICKICAIFANLLDLAAGTCQPGDRVSGDVRRLADDGNFACQRSFIHRKPNGRVVFADKRQHPRQLLLPPAVVGGGPQGGRREWGVWGGGE